MYQYLRPNGHFKKFFPSFPSLINSPFLGIPSVPSPLSGSPATEFGSNVVVFANYLAHTKCIPIRM